MLKRFSVTNFKNFEEKTTFHFDEVKDYQFNTGLIKNGLLNKALVYGPNGSGKSNLGFALMEMTNQLIESRDRSHYQNFTNANSGSTTAIFEYVFSNDENEEIVYEYAKNISLELEYEKVFYKGQIIYHYDYLKGGLIVPLKEAKTLDFSNLTKDLSGIKYIKNTVPLPRNHPIRYIVEFAEGMLWFRSLRMNEFRGIENGASTLSSLIGDPAYLGDFNKFLKSGGLNYDLVATPKNKITDTPFVGVRFKKRTLDFFSIASAGTIALTVIYYWLKKAENKTKFLFIDEFDAFYHYDLAEQILKLINSKTEFQSVLTTHNTYLMSNAFMRPDAYFQIENNQISSLADSTNKVIRQGNNIERMYISNEFAGK